MDAKKAIDKLAWRANQYTKALGTAGCNEALQKLKRAARDYANSLRDARAKH